MGKRVRNVKVEFFVREDEKVKLLFVTKEQGFRNLSAYLRHISLNPVIYNAPINENIMVRLASDLSRFGNNVNQIAKALHQGQIFSEDVKKIMEYQKNLTDSLNKLRRHISNKF